MAKFSKVTIRKTLPDGSIQIVGEQKAYSPKTMKKVVGTIAQRPMKHERRTVV